MEEWQFFLRGGSVLDRSQQPANPSPLWISEEAWDNMTVRAGGGWAPVLAVGKGRRVHTCGRGRACWH